MDLLAAEADESFITDKFNKHLSKKLRKQQQQKKQEQKQNETNEKKKSKSVNSLRYYHYLEVSSYI